MTIRPLLAVMTTFFTLRSYGQVHAKQGRAVRFLFFMRLGRGLAETIAGILDSSRPVDNDMVEHYAYSASCGLGFSNDSPQSDQGRKKKSAPEVFGFRERSIAVHFLQNFIY